MQSTNLTARAAVGPAFIVVASVLACYAIGASVLQAVSTMGIG